MSFFLYIYFPTILKTSNLSLYIYPWVAVETFIFQITFMVCFSFFLDLRCILALVRICPVQDMQAGAKLVAYLLQTSLVIPFYK